MNNTSSSNDSHSADIQRVTGFQKPLGRKKLDTLAQTGTGHPLKPPIELIGNGSSIQDKSMLTGKAKRKHITQKIVLELIKLAQKKGDSEFEKSLWNTYYCLVHVIVADKKLYGRYCKNRICTVCNSNRKADIINKYLPVIEKWGKAYLVTLTVKSCYANRLIEWMDAMKRAFKKINTKCKKRYQRGKGPKVLGIKSLECNFNPKTRTYNPHYHLIVPSWEVATVLKREWMELWTKKFTNGWAQDIRKIDNNIDGLIEAVKYGSKIFTEPNPNNKKVYKVSHKVYTAALYNILYSMKGIRLFERFGFNLPKPTNCTGNLSSIFNEYSTLSYCSEIQDWVNEETGESLTNYQITPELSDILNNIDTELI